MSEDPHAEVRARWDCVGATWTPRQRLHPGNVAWSSARGDGSPVPDATYAWGDPLVGLADVWEDPTSLGPAEVSLHVSPEADHDERARILQELMDAHPHLPWRCPGRT